jgi:hypothetical protein
MYNATWPPEVIGSDATYLINYFRGYTTSHPCAFDGFWASADVNGDCKVIGSDVTRLTNYLRGIGQIGWCGDSQGDSAYYPPFWLSAANLPDDPPFGWPGCDPIELDANAIIIPPEISK